MGRLLLVLFAVSVLDAAPAPTAPGAFQPPADLEAFAKNVREGIRLEYAEPVRFDYIEEGPDVDVSMLGKVSVGPVQTFEVRQNPSGGPWKRLIAVNGKPLDAKELGRLDAEHERNMQKLRSETPRQRAARVKEEADENRERDEILDDAERVFAFSYVSRDAIDGQPVFVFDLTPRANARVTTSDGQRMKKFAGRVWISVDDCRLARVRLQAVDNVSVGWGAVARVDRGSGFDFVRKRVAGEWVASSLTIQGTGSTLFFRNFSIKTVTKYSGHRPYAPTSE